MTKRTLTSQVPSSVGSRVKIKGWVDARRDHGKIIFLDIRDRWGIVQVVFIPSNKDSYKKASDVKSESVLEIEGVVNKRPDNMINDNIATGEVEILAESLKILGETKTVPFETEDTSNINEEKRLEYRYIDIRSKRMAENIKKRHKINLFIRNWLSKENFLEIETPILTKSTPEGARDYIVPSRTNKGKFFALPQAPQQYKQLLMIGGIEKYFQIARCFRDEDLRGDRQPEFTQLDMEMSFVNPEDIMDTLETLMIKLLGELYPNKKITFSPFKKITWQESMDKYNTDKPDLRKNKKDDDELAFAWITDFPLFEYNEDDKKAVPSHHPFTGFKSQDKKFLSTDPLKVRSTAFDLVLNGVEIGSGSTRIHDKSTQKAVFGALGISDKEAQKRFGHLLKAFDYGVPPHGGMAWGLDRLVMILQKERSVREVIAFPKTQEAKDPLMDAPSEIDDKQLREVNIKTIEEK